MSEGPFAVENQSEKRSAEIGVFVNTRVEGQHIFIVSVASIVIRVFSESNSCYLEYQCKEFLGHMCRGMHLTPVSWCIHVGSD